MAMAKTVKNLDLTVEDVRSSFAKYALKKAFNTIDITRTTMKQTADIPNPEFDEALEGAQISIVKAVATL